MSLAPLYDPRAWNVRLREESSPHAGLFLQSWEWGDFLRAVGREVRRFSHGHTIAQVVSHPIRGSLFGWDLYRGPVGSEAMLKLIIHDLRTTKGIFLHVEPTRDFRFQILPVGRQVSDFRFSNNRQPRKTLLLDLAKSEDELLRGMHEKTRYNIRVAERHGVRVEAAIPTAAQFAQFWQLLRATAGRDRFHLHSRAYYETMLSHFASPSPSHDSFSVQYHGAYHATELTAGAIVGYFGDTATYLHGASSYAHRAFMAPYALHWEIIRDAKAHGFKWYDFWGIDATRWPGVTRFKKGFGGIEVSHPEAEDLPLRKNLYRMYRLAQKIFR